MIACQSGHNFIFKKNVFKRVYFVKLISNLEMNTISDFSFLFFKSRIIKTESDTYSGNTAVK
jgi:hypothetical protein